MDPINPFMPPSLFLEGRDQTPVLDTSLPVRNPPLLDLHDHNPDLLPLDKATGSTVSLRRSAPSIPKAPMFLASLVHEIVILQVLLLAPDLFLTALLHHPRFAVDRRADATQRAGIDIQQKTGQTGPCRLRRRRAFTREVRSASRRPMGYPVVHKN